MSIDNLRKIRIVSNITEFISSEPVTATNIAITLGSQVNADEYNSDREDFLGCSAGELLKALNLRTKQAAARSRPAVRAAPLDDCRIVKKFATLRSVQ